MKHKGDTEKSPDGLGILMAAYDWQRAMEYAKFEFKDVAEILIAKEGCNEEEHWELLAKLKSGMYGWLEAGCDSSGWDCQSGGSSDIVESVPKSLKELKDLKDREKNIFDCIDRIQQIKNDGVESGHDTTGEWSNPGYCEAWKTVCELLRNELRK